jgi:chromosome segregation ATPase
MSKSIEKQLERERAGLRDPQERIHHLLEALSKASRKRERYQEMYAETDMTLEEFKSKLSAVDAEKKALEAELARLEDTKAELKRLERLAEEIPKFLADLPDLIEGSADHVQEYETVPPERTEENPLGIYTLTPERIRQREPEELEEIRRERERARAERFRWVYQELGLKIIVRKDGTLELSGVFGSALRHHRESSPTPG